MKRLLILFIITAFCMLVVSCELEVSDNGKLDGFWQLYSMDNLSEGISVDMRSQQVSWSFQNRIMLAKRDVRKEVVFYFEHRADSLFMSDPYFSDREVEDVKVLRPEELNELGIFKLKEEYKILELSNNTMRLQSDMARLTFRKY